MLYALDQNLTARHKNLIHASFWSIVCMVQSIGAVSLASLPYITSAGNIDKVLAAIRAAAVPERVSQDFVKTILKIPGGSGDQMTTFLKKINFAASDGRPTELYTKSRNPSTSGAAIAQALRYAYAPLYVRNEFAHELNDSDLLGLIVEETGQPHDSNSVKMAFSSFKALKRNATFGDAPKISDEAVAVQSGGGSLGSSGVSLKPHEASPRPASVGLNLGYTINLNLPATSDPAVFNAIFKSLKQHLLSDDDA